MRVDVDGRTSLPGLYASGECAASGLHGANRLASNSLLEGLVFSRRIARVIGADLMEFGAAPGLDSGPTEAAGSSTSPDAVPEQSAEHAAETAAAVESQVDLLSAAMSGHVGMSRDDGGLRVALAEIDGIASALAPAQLSRQHMEAVNLATVAALIALAAETRTESRGCHSRVDFPGRDDARWRRRLVWRLGSGYRSVDVAKGE